VVISCPTPSLLLSSSPLPPLLPAPDLRTLLALPSLRKQLLRATLTHCLSLPAPRIAPFLSLLCTAYLQLLPPDDRLTLGELLEAIQDVRKEGGHSQERVREVIEAVMRMVTIGKAVKGEEDADKEEEMMCD
jgi:hypothetical protein